MNYTKSVFNKIFFGSEVLVVDNKNLNLITQFSYSHILQCSYLN